MVYIEDRIADLESIVKALSGQLKEARAEISAFNDKKRKANQVDQELLEKAVKELHAAIDKKADRQELAAGLGQKVGKEEFHAALESKVEREDLNKVAQELRAAVEERPAAATGGDRDTPSVPGSGPGREEVTQLLTEVQADIEKKLAMAVHREELVRTVAGITSSTSQAVSSLQAQLGQKLQLSEAQLQQKLQGALAPLQSVQPVLQAAQEQMQRLQANQEHYNNMQLAKRWLDIDTNDQGPFDISKVYRMRIGEGTSSRWLYSSEVSMGQVYISDNILDQSVVVNSGSKGSYGARRIGSDINSTVYFAVFQLQCRAV